MTREVKIYTLDYCPFCQKAKMFFDEHNIKYEEISCEENEDEMREKLTKEYHLSYLATFPQIIIDGKNIGGYTDLIEKFQNNEISFD